jgi:hypothetical protein
LRERERREEKRGEREREKKGDDLKETGQLT